MKKEFKKNIVKNKNKIIIGFVCLVILLVVVLLIFNNVNDDKNNEANSNNNDNVVLDDVTEKDIIDAYNFTMDDAKELVKQEFNSDNFEFTVTISTDAKYIVEVKNIINNNVYKYEVDPATKTYVEI